MGTSLCHLRITKSIANYDDIIPLFKLFIELWKLRKNSFIFIECMNNFSFNTFCKSLFISVKTIDDIRNIRKIALIILHKKWNHISTATRRKNYKRNSVFIQYSEAINNAFSQLKMSILSDIFQIAKSELGSN